MSGRRSANTIRACGDVAARQGRIHDRKTRLCRCVNILANRGWSIHVILNDRYLRVGASAPGGRRREPAASGHRSFHDSGDRGVFKPSAWAESGATAKALPPVHESGQPFRQMIKHASDAGGGADVLVHGEPDLQREGDRVSQQPHEVRIAFGDVLLAAADA